MIIKHSCPTIGKEELEAVKRVLQSKHIAQGEKVREFEEKFGKYIGTKYAVACNSGTSALHLALLALGIGSSDEIIIPSYICAALLNAVNYVGAGFRLVDIDISDYNISFKAVKKSISRRTKAIIVPHMFGQAARIEDFLRLGIPVIEDCALSVGAEYKNKRVGSFGLVSIFSFYATKMLTTAEGGMVLTNDRKIADRLKDLRDYDEKDNYRTRYNYKMTDLEAALGIAQLGKISTFIKRRKEIADKYNKEFAPLGINVPGDSTETKRVYSRYVLRVDKNKRNILLSRLNKKGIELKRPVFKSLHRYLGLKDSEFNNASLAEDTAISFPIYPSLSGGQVNKIIVSFREQFNRL
jgi:perosamine synthetase